MNKKPKHKSPRYWDRSMAPVALLIIVIAWFIGAARSEEALAPYMKQVIPGTQYIEPGPGDTYSAWKSAKKEKLLGYIAVGRAHGYGGEMTVAAAVDTAGKVLHTLVISHKETSAFFKRVSGSNFPGTLEVKSYADAFLLGGDLDGITGATLSSRALAGAVRRAARKAAVENLGVEDIPEPAPSIRFGLPEIILLLLFAVGIIGRMSKFKYTKTARWVSMLTGMVFLGFVFNLPLTIVLINKMLLGFWPQWQTYLYWYLLVGGVLLIYAVDNKNPYCEWFCPFGAAQDCLAVIGGGKLRVPDKFRVPLRWFPRLLALGAIVIALIYRNPGISSYEVFGAMFHLVGSTFLFALLAVVLVVSLFMKRPWCAYLCPMRPVTDFVRLSRNWIKEKVNRPGAVKS